MDELGQQAQILTFLTAVFGSKPTDSFILIWTLPDKRSSWFDTIEEAAIYIERVKKDKDVYVEMSLSDRMFQGRCKAEDSAGIPGVWIDLDCAAEGRSKTGVFTDKNEALDFIKVLPIKPTIVINSGGGFHVYWLFKEMWIFDRSEERANASLLVKGWLEAVRLRAAAVGREIDSVGDLARVMRVPGTFNHKDTRNRRLCYIESIDDSQRYNPQEIEECTSFDEKEWAEVKESLGVGGAKNSESNYDFKLLQNAVPPPGKWDALKDLDPRVELSFNHTRKDFTADSSASAYDLSLAAFAAQVDWSDQEIVNLLIASRRANHCDLKLSRHDYYRNTILVARKNHRYDQANEELSTVEINKDNPEEPAHPGGPNVIDVLESLLLFRLKKVIKYLASEPIYYLETDQGNIAIGEVGNLITQTAFRKKVAALTGIYIPLKSPAKWSKIAQLLLDLCVPETLGEDSTEIGQIDEWVDDYLDQWKPTNANMDKDLSDAIRMRLPFYKNEYVYLFQASFKEWILKVRGDLSVLTRNLGPSLKLCGWEPSPIMVVYQGRRSSRAAWRKIDLIATQEYLYTKDKRKVDETYN